MKRRIGKILPWMFYGFIAVAILSEILFIFALIFFTPDIDKELRKVDYNYELRDPTYDEMKEFLARDETDSNDFNKGILGVFGNYDCSNFARDVRENAIKKGIRCACVLIRFLNRAGHAIIAFNTIDRGVIFIEPQTDKEMKVVVGGKYWNNTIVACRVYWPNKN